MARKKPHAAPNRIRARFLAIQRLADEATDTFRHEPIRTALQEVFTATATIARSHSLTVSQRMAAAIVAVEASHKVRCLPSLRKSAEDLLAQHEVRGIQPDFGGVLAGATPDRVKALVHTISVGMYDTGLPVLVWEDQKDQRSAADLLAAAASRQDAGGSALEADAPDYDLSENDLRLQSIEIKGFRGSPKRVTVKFERSGTAVSTIIFGENGVGKSTIVDAIEFALQGRIGRSSNFESPVGSSARSFADDGIPRVVALLSDQRQVERRIIEASSGYLTASPDAVSSGFRLAPVTLNRNDISRFLDTDAMERGSLLLDYFPSEAGKLATRPQNEIHRLTAEQSELRIRRTSAASELADLLGCSPLEVADRAKFLTTVRTTIMGGLAWRHFEDQDGWRHVAPDIKSATVRLASIYNDLAASKKRIKDANNMLNPVVHAKQASILRPILSSIGTELSRAFNRIASGYPVERIDVVFAESGPLSLDVVVLLSNGRNCFPQQLFSEAYKDLIALLFFTSVAKKAAERGQARILILDDVLQSVDSTVRHAFMTYVLEEFSDWQLIVTVHDRLWRDQLRDLFDAHDHDLLGLEVRNWEFETGPVLDPPAVDRVTKDLQLLLTAGEPRSIAAVAGQLLEFACDRITLSMRLNIPRQEKYTLGDLWPVVRSCLSDTAAGDAIRRVASHKLLRNLTVHPDPRSWDLTRVDARSFANAVLDLVGHTRCNSCGWLPKSGVCKCGAVRL